MQNFAVRQKNITLFMCDFVCTVLFKQNVPTPDGKTNTPMRPSAQFQDNDLPEVIYFTSEFLVARSDRLPNLVNML